MIRVVVTEGASREIHKVEVSGHAMTGDPGYDLVCAGVSSVIIGALNGFEALDNETEIVMIDDPYISITCNKTNKINQLLLQFLLIQLQTIEEAHPDALEILEKEDIQ